MSGVFGNFNSGHTAFELEKSLTDYVLCIVSSSEGTFQHFESFHNIFPQFKVKCAAHITVLSSLSFSRYSKIASGVTHTCT
jgi:hypothetical protein